MKQVIQNYRSGRLTVSEVPAPALLPGGILVRNVASVVSVGTEKLMMDLARKSLLGKARARPDLVRQVVNKARVDGVLEAYRAAMGRLDTPVPLGYSSAGVVLEVAPGVEEFRVNDAVACFGSNYASHSEIVWVPHNMAVKVPEGVGLEAAAFAGVGAIALHAVRTAQVKLGDRVAVIGMGLLGLLAVQLLKASGCPVFGIDLDAGKVSLACQLGADEAAINEEDVAKRVLAFSDGWGVDAVLVLASSDGNEAVELAAEVVRPRGRLVVPGMVKLDLPRRLFYDKEIQLEVSRSAGPGVYDPVFERQGMDYPLPYVRWTAQRNMEQFLSLVASGRLSVEPIVTHRYPIQEADKAYQTILKGSKERQIGVVLCYGETHLERRRVPLKVVPEGERRPQRQVRVGVIGAGLFARSTLLPILKGLPELQMRGIATASGTTARHAGERYGFAYCTSNYQEILADPEVDCVVIATRHNLHASMAREALSKGKDVLVEKPLAADLEQLQGLVRTYQATRTANGLSGSGNVGPRLMVGFNRRFSPFSLRAKKLLERRSSPLLLHIRVNAGAVARDSWVNDPQEGGGRIIGEVCHFVDLAQFLTGSLPTRSHVESIGGTHRDSSSQENVAISLAFRDGSLASMVYTAQGDRGFSRERVELFWDQSVCLIDNFKSLSFTRNGRSRRMKRWNVDRGHRGEMEAFFGALRRGEPSPTSFLDHVYTTLATFCMVDSLSQRRPVDIDPAHYGLEL